MKSIRDVRIDIHRLLCLFEKEEYILWFNPIDKKGTIVLKNNVSPISQLKAWSHALMVAKRVATLRAEEAERVNNKSLFEKGGEKSKQRDQQRNETDSVANPTDPDTMFSILESTLQTHSTNFKGQIALLKDAGWDVETPSLETRPGRRFEVVE